MGNMAAPDATVTQKRLAVASPWLRRAALLATSIVWLAAVLAWHSVLAPAPDLTVTFLDVGQGDSIVVRTPRGHILVVDTGWVTPDDDAGRSVVLPYLRAQGVNRIDALLLTHPDDDHIGGAHTLIERIKIDRLLVSSLPSTAPNYIRVLNAARERGVKVEHLARGQAFGFHGPAFAEVLNPPAGAQPRSRHSDNDGSLVVRVRFGRTSLLLTGDAEAVAEQDMAYNGLDLHAEVLKLGHHGSKTSSSEVFLDRVHPAVAIVSAGRRNVFGHPHPDIMARLANRGIRVFRTDRDGSIRVKSDGERLRISAFRRGQSR
jgi:competence protein ComEC